jgi:hypothetical protein
MGLRYKVIQVTLAGAALLLFAVLAGPSMAGFSATGATSGISVIDATSGISADVGFSPDPNCEVVLDPNVPDRVVGQDCTKHLIGLYEQTRDEIAQQQADGYSCQFFTQNGQFPTFDEWANGVPGLGPNDPFVSCDPPSPNCINLEGHSGQCDERPQWCSDTAPSGAPGWCASTLHERELPLAPTSTDAIRIQVDVTQDRGCFAHEYDTASGEWLRTYPVTCPVDSGSSSSQTYTVHCLNEENDDPCPINGIPLAADDPRLYEYFVRMKREVESQVESGRYDCLFNTADGTFPQDLETFLTAYRSKFAGVGVLEPGTLFRCRSKP